ncbi:MAG: SMP-30/gluconolactonase/LRE family protein [Alphaproteobacteria bacterium]|nr:SMP-30/gluconolactonase/LRE family protein [Alphaproteobacteria bacterium]
MLVLALLACKSPATDPDTDTDATDTAPPTPTADTAPEIPVIDCTVLPGPPFDAAQLAAPRAYHGVAFDQQGRLVGSDGSNFVAATSPDDTTLLIPNAGYSEQIEFLPTGELITSTNGQIRKYTEGGGMQVLANQIDAYGVTIGPDGKIYTANNDRIHRIDPVTGDVEVWLDFPPNISPKVLDFSVDHQTMYVGTLSDSGNVYAVSLDASFDPVGTPTFFASTPGNWHDGLRVDACGRVYVAEYNTTALYMITPDGTSQTLLDYPFDLYGHGLNWGSGVGEWDDHTIYVPQPYDGNRVGKLHVGVPYRTWNGGVYEVIR